MPGHFSHPGTTARWLLAAPQPACLPAGNEDIAAVLHGFGQSRISFVPRVLVQANTSGLELLFKSEVLVQQELSSGIHLGLMAHLH